jgi:DNA replication protein DnaC
MAYNRENLARVREIYATKHLKAEGEADARRAELQARIPGLAAIDRELARTGPRLMDVALHKSDETVDGIKEDVTRLRKERDALLVAGGYPADYTDPRYECGICRDSGYDGLKMCACMKRELAEAGYRSAGISRLVRECTFESFDLSYYSSDRSAYDNMSLVFRKLREYADGFDPASSPNLILFGGTGLGKTHLSVAVAKTVVEAGWDAVYTGAIGMISDFESARFGSADGTASGNATDRYFGCDLLVIDDLGTEVVNQYTTGCIYEIINRRINTGRPTIISCNLNQREIGTRYTDRIASRIFGEYLPLIFTGTDVRLIRLTRERG